MTTVGWRHLKGRNLALICGESPHGRAFLSCCATTLRMFFVVVVFSKLPLVGIVKRLFSGVNNRYSEVIVFSFSLSVFLACLCPLLVCL